MDFKEVGPQCLFVSNMHLPPKECTATCKLILCYINPLGGSTKLIMFAWPTSYPLVRCIHFKKQGQWTHFFQVNVMDTYKKK